jgi:hypothetical protein
VRRSLNYQTSIPPFPNGPYASRDTITSELQAVSRHAKSAETFTYQINSNWSIVRFSV